MKRFPPRPHKSRPPQAERQRQRPQEEPQRHRRDVLRVAGLPAVQALFAKAPQAVQRLLVTPNMAQAASDLLREATARTRPPKRLTASSRLVGSGGSTRSGWALSRWAVSAASIASSSSGGGLSGPSSGSAPGSSGRLPCARLLRLRAATC
jgi:hypothetical protein